MNEINPYKQNNYLEPNTPDWLRSFEGCENYSDEEATEILHNIDILAEILLKAGNRSSSKTETTLIPLYKPLNKKAA